jgi:hypothetical protein
MGRRNSKRTGDRFIDSLEARRMMAQISVTNFGAVPNDGRDDLGAIKAAMNASAAGDTIYFPAGTYNVSDQVFLKGSRTYSGQDPSNTVIRDLDLSRHIFHIQQDNTTVQNFTIEGKPFMVDSNNGMVAGMLINNNVIRNTGTGTDNNAITFTTGLRNSKISNNTFDGLGPMGIYGYYWDGLTIANNEFLNGGQGLHLDDHSNNSNNLVIEQNLFSGIRRMGVEYQGGGHNLVLQDNWYEKPVMSTNFADNGATFAFSIVADRSTGTIARRNVIWAPERPDGVGVRIGFETGGDGTLVENNYVYGINQVLANTDGTGTTSCLAQNNYYSNTLDGLVGRGLTKINNGPQVNLQWLINRGKPGRNRRFTDPSNPNGGISTGGSTTSSTPTQPTTSFNVPAQSGATYLSDLGWASMSNGWGTAEKDESNGETGTSDGKTITLNGKTYQKGLGTHASSTIVYNLNGQYSEFLADIGLDDEVGNNGSVAFQVYLDGAKVFDSGRMTGASATQQLDLNVSGKNQLKLVIDPSDGGNAYDHADWANARLLQGTSGGSSGGTNTSPPPSASASWLSDLNWSYMTNGWGSVEKDKSNGEMGAGDGRTIAIRSNTYTKGLGVHAASDVRYNISGKGYTSFTSDLGLDNETNGNGSVVFQVYLDGVLKYDSGIVRGRDAVKQLVLNVSGANELRLVVNNAGDGNAFDHADWAGAKLS